MDRSVRALPLTKIKAGVKIGRGKEIIWMEGVCVFFFLSSLQALKNRSF